MAFCSFPRVSFRTFNTPYAGSLNITKNQTLANNSVFADDGNAGLVETVCQAYSHNRVARLTAVYLTLPLAKIQQVANLSDLASAEKMVLTMIQTGKVNAKIDQSLGVVHFLFSQASRNMDAELEKLLLFGSTLSAVDDRLAQHKKYIQNLVQRASGTSSTTDAALLSAASGAWQDAAEFSSAGGTHRMS